ncbi:50S ribosomal protein L24 [Candidatus Woesearchaeota archaeon]|nr:large subunit ribosomal protein L24 [uncultured archaeon]KHO47198.1 MAG: large subunit ribosomal protein L24 [archaeon GW2011_AR4]MBS3129181.1 50S ribosomal protein L24 [Candidatus Woesearchaeota archaeon]HIH37914.1 50S ribosomal protein L24 [Candidatus Woesearchaeota archaeon]HIH48877.1 50S ribosomal protein L24 [Candidatus Woesearchaeota archaeon]
MSIKPKKQRKAQSQAPAHKRSEAIVSPLSKELRSRHKRRNIRLIVGDKVKVMRGSMKGKSGVVRTVKVKDQKVLIEGIDRGKKDGSRALIPLHPSNLQIIDIKLDDKLRIKRK